MTSLRRALTRSLYTAVAVVGVISVAVTYWEARGDNDSLVDILMTLIPLMVLFPVLGLVITFAIRRELQPLQAVASSVAARAPLALDPLPVETVPEEIRPLIEEINRLLARLQTAMEREQRFVIDAAHALRTPLTALQLQADVLDGSDDPAEGVTRLAELRAGIQRAVHLSNQLLSLAGSESTAGKAAEVTDLDVALCDVTALYRPAANARGIDLRLDTHSAATVFSDPRRIILICGNLLDNALRYTPRGGRVDLRGARNGAAACIEVCDEGPGLAENELSRVFERFYRAPGDASEGSGLGLATVENLVKQAGGQITLHNRSDRSGLIARVTLPLVPAETS